MVERAEAEGLLTPGLHDPGADQRQHRHLAGHGRAARGLPADLRDAGEHLGGAPPAAADVGRRDHLLAGRRRLQRGRREWPRSSRPSTPTGSCSTSTATRPTPTRTTDAPAPEILADLPDDHPFRRPASAPPGTLMGVGRFFREHKPGGPRSSPPSRATASWSTGCATWTRASSRSCTTSRCSTRASRSAPATRCAGCASCSRSRASSPASPPARSCTRRSAQARQVRDGRRARRHRVRRRRRRLEVPLHRRLRGHARRGGGSLEGQLWA